MIYRVKIGTTTRKGNFITQIEKVVNFSGELSELNSIFYERYMGFSVEITLVEDVEDVKSKVQDSVRVGELDSFYNYVLKNKQFNSCDYVSKELVRKYRDTEKEFNKAKEMLFEEFRKEVKNNNITVSSLVNIKIDHYDNIICDVSFAGELFQTKPQPVDPVEIGKVEIPYTPLEDVTPDQLSVGNIEEDDSMDLPF